MSNSLQNIYIQSATLNGQPYANSYLLHRDIVAGRALQLTMGPQANHAFGTAPANRPKEVYQANGSIINRVMLSLRSILSRQNMPFERAEMLR